MFVRFARTALLTGLAPLVIATSGCAARPQGHGSAVLPLTTLRLYETGVGYFERSGTISAKTDALPVPASHVDDALKTLVVMTADGKASVRGIEFDSVMSRGLARSLAALPLGTEEEIGYGAVLQSLTGVDVALEVKAGSSVDRFKGRLLEVVKAPPIPLAAPRKPKDGEAKSSDKKPDHAPDTQDDYYLTVLDDDGAVHRVRSSQLASIRPIDGALSDRLGAAASALSGRAAQIQRRLRVLATKDTAVRIGYIAETPVWRASYRLIVDSKKPLARLQGWALLHNDTDEPWANVKVELVNGQPDSFLFPLSAPRYSRRTLASPEERLSTVPQLANQTPDQIWGDNLDQIPLANVGVLGHGYGSGSGSGYGSGHGRLGRVRLGSAMSQTIQLGDLAAVAEAKGVEAGALFQYQLAKPLALRAHGSTLVPFSSNDVDTRRLSWFDRIGNRGRSAVRLVNSTNQTIPTGPIAIYEATGFAGETGIPRLKPTERAFLQFGVDLDVELTADDEKAVVDTTSVKALEYSYETLRAHYVRHRERSITIRNRSTSARVVYLALDVVKNAKVEGADELDYDLATKRALAVFRVGPQAEITRRIITDEALMRRTRIDSLVAKKVRNLSTEPELDATQRAIVADVAIRIEALEANTKQTDENSTAIRRLNADLKRVREHLSAMGGPNASVGNDNPLVTRLLSLEDALTKARAEADRLAKARKEQIKTAELELKKLNANP